jgi:hypothetical protein
VPAFDDVQAGVDLALKVAVAEAAGDEDRLLHPAEFQHRLVDGVRRVAGEATQDRLGRGGADADRGRVLGVRG